MTKLEQLTDLIESRRSVFPEFYSSDEKLEDEQVWQVLHNANWAPNHKKTEPWRFYVYTGGEKLKELGNFLANWYKDNTPPEEYQERKFKKLKKKPRLASHVIAICYQRDPEEKVPEWEEIAAVSCAVQNMYLTTHALGIGSYWASPKPAMEAGEFYGLKKGEKCLGLFYMGVPQEGMTIKSDRGDIKDKVVWNASTR